MWEPGEPAENLHRQTRRGEHSGNGTLNLVAAAGLDWSEHWWLSANCWNMWETKQQCSRLVTATTDAWSVEEWKQSAFFSSCSHLIPLSSPSSVLDDRLSWIIQQQQQQLDVCMDHPIQIQIQMWCSWFRCDWRSNQPGAKPPRSSKNLLGYFWEEKLNVWLEATTNKMRRSSSFSVLLLLICLLLPLLFLKPATQKHSEIPDVPVDQKGDVMFKYLTVQLSKIDQSECESKTSFIPSSP